MKNRKPKILVAPLHWGIGHATRCVPIIEQLLEQGFEPIIASDGDALLLLKEQFPNLKFYELPRYNIRYTKNGFLLKYKLLFQSKRILQTIKKENQVINDIVKNENINGIISDNRFGVCHKNIPSIYITHQLQVKSGLTTLLSSKIHQKIMKNFDEVWIPDEENSKYSGELSNVNIPIRKKYIGILSRLNYQKLSIKYDVLVLLSGPEPQRTLLENKLVIEFKKSDKNILFVRGLINSSHKIADFNNCKIVNYLNQTELQQVINQSNLVIARSGYSTIMDLANLGKKALFIPTPGQYEQLYLANYLNQKRIAPYVLQHQFNFDSFTNFNAYTGFLKRNNTLNLDFTIFKPNLR